MLAAQQAEAHRSQDRKIERMETKTSLARLERNLKAHFRRPADKRPPSDAVTIPPLTAEQYTAVKNWNTAVQVATYGLTAGIGAIIGAIIGIAVGGVAGGIVGGVVGAMLGAGWGAYEAICISSVQDEFDEAYKQSSVVTVWRDGWKFNVDATSRDGMYTQANAPLSALYVAATTFLLTGKIP
jgi:energy-converting hydrogenase Eha subunit A